MRPGLFIVGSTINEIRQGQYFDGATVQTTLAEGIDELKSVVHDQEDDGFVLYELVPIKSAKMSEVLVVDYQEK